MDFNQFRWFQSLAIIIFVDAPIFVQWELIELAPHLLDPNSLL